MAQNGNRMPDPDAVWIALGMVIWAIALALGGRRRGAFIAALAALTEDQDARRQVVSIHTTNGRKRAFTQSVQVAATYLARIVAELRAARG